MHNVKSPNGLIQSDTSSHIFYTLDNGWMGFHFVDMTMMAHKWAGSQHLGKCTPYIIQHLMDNVALGYDWKLLR